MLDKFKQVEEISFHITGNAIYFISHYIYKSSLLYLIHSFITNLDV